MERERKLIINVPMWLLVGFFLIYLFIISDYDPAVVEQKEASQPACIPLSYVLKFFTASRREFQSMPAAVDVRRRLMSAPQTPSIRSNTPTGYCIKS